MRVLIADDELRLRKVVALHLKKCGYDVVEAGNGALALVLARNEIPDIFVLDVMMPEMDGISACKAIKADDTLKNIPVILLTANASTEDIQIGKEAGADSYMTKPFSPKELVEVIQSLTQ